MQLGIKLLVAVFEAVSSVREALLRELQGRLVGVKEEVALPFVAVLGLLVQKHPRAVLEHANLLKVSTTHRVMHTLPLLISCISSAKMQIAPGLFGGILTFFNGDANCGDEITGAVTLNP